MEDIGGGLHPAVEGQSLDEDDDEDEDEDEDMVPACSENSSKRSHSAKPIFSGSGEKCVQPLVKPRTGHKT